jgi:hypothetical protein
MSKELHFASTEEALSYLADVLGQRVVVATKKPPVKNPRGDPKTKGEERNWDKAQMWGDPVHHKYPLFDDRTGAFDYTRAMAALKYLNMPRSKASYKKKNGEYDYDKLAQVLGKIISGIFKTDATAKVRYQPKDEMYRRLPENIKKKLEGYSKKASEDDELVFASAEEGVQYLTDLLGEQVIVANDDDEDEEDDEEEEEEEEEEAELEREEGTCPSCDGSGEGAQEGTKCRVCGGSGDSSKPWGSAKKRREREGVESEIEEVLQKIAETGKSNKWRVIEKIWEETTGEPVPDVDEASDPDLISRNKQNAQKTLKRVRSLKKAGVLCFASAAEGIQHLADLTGQQVTLTADEDDN